MVAQRLLACATAAFILLGCRERSILPTSEMMQIVTPSIGVGQNVVVKFPQPVDSKADRHWITIVEAGQADSNYGAWQFVDSTTREVTLAAPATPGSYEVRLHDKYPTMPHHVVARSALTVTGSATAVSPPIASDTQPAEVTAVAAAPVTAAPSVPEADVAAMAAIDFGAPSTRFEPVLPVQRWAKDGGGNEIVSPSAGHRFLVVEFPHTGTQSGQIYYDSRQVFLRVGGDLLQAYAVTFGGAAAPKSAVTPDGRRVFQRDVYASQYAPTPDLPFAVAFQIPADATQGTLKLGKRETSLSW